MNIDELESKYLNEFNNLKVANMRKKQSNPTTYDKQTGYKVNKEKIKLLKRVMNDIRKVRNDN